MSEPLTITAEHIYALIEGPTDEAVRFLTAIAEAMIRSHSEQATVITGWTPNVAELPDGTQVLAAIQEDGSVHVATRAESRHTWGPPLPIIEGAPTRVWAVRIDGIASRSVERAGE